MTDNAAASLDLEPGGSIAIKLRRDKDGQFFEFPTGWKFTDNKATAHQAKSAEGRCQSFRKKCTDSLSDQNQW